MIDVDSLETCRPMCECSVKSIGWHGVRDDVVVGREGDGTLLAGCLSYTGESYSVILTDG